MAYRGKFFPNNPAKYKGNIDAIVFRSLWEFKVFLWCDKNPSVKYWNSEEIIIPYVCKTDGKWHRYFLDVEIGFVSGRTYWVEIKPEKETIPPVRKKQHQKTYLREVMTYAKNTSKWDAAELEAKRKGKIFQIWTEKTLAKLGISIT